MAHLIDIEKVTIGRRALTARIHIADEAPLFTDGDPEGTARIAELMPELANHLCVGDGGTTFGEVMDRTELAHLVEHVSVELLARTNRAGAVSGGQTRRISDIDRLYEIRLACPDDVLVAGALSSASWIIDWAYSGGGEPEPDVDAIAKGLAGLVDNLASTSAAEPETEPAIDSDATVVSSPVVLDDEPALGSDADATIFVAPGNDIVVEDLPEPVDEPVEPVEEEPQEEA